MPEDNTNTPATLTLLPAAKKRATKGDLVMMIAELEYQKRQKEADALKEKQLKFLNALYDEAKKEFAKKLLEMKPEDFERNTFMFSDEVSFRFEIKDNNKMANLRMKWRAISVPSVYRENVLKEVRSKLEAHRTDHIKLALAEDPALRQGVEELRKQLFSE